MRKFRLGAGALVVMACVSGCMKSSPYLAGAGSDLNSAKHAPPTFRDPVLQQYRARFLADRAAWDANPTGFLPAVDADSSCDLSAGRAEELVLGMPREKFLQLMETHGTKARITSIQWRVISGECPDGVLSGPVVFRADYTLKGSSSAGEIKVETTTTAQMLTQGEFAQGSPTGKQVRHRMDTTLASVDGAVNRDVTRTFEYEEVRGKELVGKSLTFRLMPNLGIAQAVVTEPLEPGVTRMVVYDGQREAAIMHQQDRISHGETVMKMEGVPDHRLCYNAGVLVALEACDGYRVNVAAAVPLNATPGQTAMRSTAPASPPKAKTASSASAAIRTEPARPAPTAAGQSGWPDLAGAMSRVGGGENDAAVIVGVENYAFVSPVPGAGKNAKDWYRYFTRVRGTSPGKVRLLLDSDATDVGLRSAMEDAAKLVGDGGSLWFVFIGHGAPSADQKDGLLVGVDAQQTAQGLYARSVAQKELVKLASVGKQKQTLFVIDACFSGRTGSGAALASGLQPLIPITEKRAEKNTLTFTAGRSDQFAGPLPKLDRPAFSYLFLGGLLGWSDTNGDGEVTATELVDYSNDALRAVLNGRNQTPEVFPKSGAPIAKSAGARGPDVAEIALGD